MSTSMPGRIWVTTGRATFAFRGISWQVTGWAEQPEVTVDPDEVRISGPALDAPGVQLEVRHTFDHTWQVRMTASADEVTEWPGAQLAISRYGPVGEGLWSQAEFDVSDDQPWLPVWTWCVGAEGYLMAADAFDQPVLIGVLRRGTTVTTDDGLAIPPAEIGPGRPMVTTWAMDELPNVAAVHAAIPAWLPAGTGFNMTDELSLNTPDHGLVIDPDLAVVEEEGVTRISAGGRAGVSEVLLHGARGTVGLPIAFAPALNDVVLELASSLVEAFEPYQLLALTPGQTMVLSMAASAGVRGAATALERGQLDADLPEQELPLIVAACAMELARTADEEWARSLLEVASAMPAVPGAGAALLRAVVGTFAADGDPQPFLDMMSRLEGTIAEKFTSPPDAVLTLEVAAIGGWAEPVHVERVAAQLGWGLPMSPTGLADPTLVAQAAAALSMVDEHLVAHWPVAPSVIGEQAVRWLVAEHAKRGATDLLAWLLLPVTQ